VTDAAKVREAWDGEHCQGCGRGYALVWAAQDDLWNEVVGSPAGTLCPECFEYECNIRDIHPFFVCYREHVNITRVERAASRNRASRRTQIPGLFEAASRGNYWAQQFLAHVQTANRVLASLDEEER